jgi:hypothetical protein
MIHNCFQCKKEFKGRKNKIYCSNKCRENFRYHNKRKGNIKYYIKQRAREKRWYMLHGKKTKRKYQKTKRFRDYQNKWRRDKKYWLEQYEKHQETHLKKAERYRKTERGYANRIKYNEKRRKKNFLLVGKRLEKIDPIFLSKIRFRDKICVYCGNKFDNNICSKKETIDHFNCNEPLSENNTVRCCWSCNSSKRNIPLEKISDWIKRKKFNPSPIVMKLLKQKLN